MVGGGDNGKKVEEHIYTDQFCWEMANSLCPGKIP